METFDGTSGHVAALSAPPDQPMAGLDTLSLLKQTVNDRVDIDEETLMVPGGRIRLVFHNEIPEKKLRHWQRASLPPALRKTGGVPLDQDQMTIAVSALVYTVLRIEVMDARDAEVWHVVENKATGNPITLQDEAVLPVFNAIDTRYALVKMFGRESDVIRASQQILAAAGWTGENGSGDDDDPR